MGQNKQRRRFKPGDLFKISVKKKRSFTPLESPAIYPIRDQRSYGVYGGDEIDKVLIPYRKDGVKASPFLTGFTLIELLIASSISIAILLTLYLSFNAGIFGYKRIQDALNTSAAAIKALSRLNLDLRNSFPYSASEARFEGNTEGIGFFTLAKTFRQNVTTQDYAHVFYGLEGDRLLRTCRRNQDSLSNTTEIGTHVLATDLQGVLFSYGEFNSDKEILE